MTTVQNGSPQDFIGTLRPLSPYERFFLTIEQVSGLNFSVAVSFRGAISHDRWRAAFAEAQRRHPLLNATINAEDSQAPTFQRGASLPVSVTFQPRTSPVQARRQ